MRRWLLLLLAFAVASARNRIAYIEFYGAEGIDVDALRKSLPVHEGDALTDGAMKRLGQSVERLTGRKAQIGGTCCVGDGDGYITIGLRTGTPARLYAAPREKLKVSAQLASLYNAMRKTEMASVMAGASTEEGHTGYRLEKDGPARSAELKVREYALAHEDELLRVLKSAVEVEQRRIACDTLGFGSRTPRQESALIEAMHDPDSDVRNNAIRALGEMVGADPSLAARIPLDPLIELLRTGTASDLNKSTLLLMEMTESRDAKLLARLKADAWDALIEFACWRVAGWTFAPRLILARIAGIPEDQALNLTAVPVGEFLDAVHR